MPFINSKSLGAPGSSCGATERGRACDFGRRARFFGLRRVEAISLDLATCDQELRQLKTKSSAGLRSRVLICAGDVVHQFSGCKKSIDCAPRFVRQKLI